MNHIDQDKRNFERIFFPTEKLIKGLFRYEGKKGPRDTSALIMNMSKDGMGITFAKGKKLEIDKNSRMLLVKTYDPGLSFMENIEVEVKWILNHESLGYMAVGCQFLNPKPEIEKKINAYIEKIKSGMDSSVIP